MSCEKFYRVRKKKNAKIYSREKGIEWILLISEEGSRVIKVLRLNK